MQMTFAPAAGMSGSVRPPGDKSISHRALLAAAMTRGRCRLSGLASGADVASTIGCLSELGYEINGAPGPASEVVLQGNGWRPRDSGELDAGNSGTTIRLLAGALAGTSGEYLLRGDSSLSRRPMDRVADPLRLMGADIELSEGDRPPITIRGKALRGVEYQQPVASAQVKGAVLFAGLQAEGRTKVIEPVPSRDHTERLLEWLGAKVQRLERSVEVWGGGELFDHGGFEMTIPGDLSSAAYFLTAAILGKDRRVEIEGVGLNPSRTGVLQIFEAMGAAIETEVFSASPEPAGRLAASSSALRATEVNGRIIPAAIDELPLVALAATQASGTTEIRDAAELRVKESDRVKTLAVALRGLGASVEELPDGWLIEGPTRLRGGRVDPAGDHRIALTLAIAGTIAEEPVAIEDWECTGISYPAFRQDLMGLTT